MDGEARSLPRKRDPNFTQEEKDLLTLLIKKSPVIETKLTDGKTIVKKKQAWSALTQEFNSNINVHRRDTITLKRAWDNMKAISRKARATEGGKFLSPGGRCSPPHHREALSMDSMVEDGAPAMLCEMEMRDASDLGSDHRSLSPNDTCGNFSNNRRSSEYIRRETEIRLKLLENKRQLEMQILQKQLQAETLRTETEEINKEAAKYLLENNKLQYEKTKFELEILRNSSK